MFQKSELLDDLVEKLPLREIYKKKSLSFKMAGGIGLASVVAHIVSRVKDSEVGCILSFIGLMSSLGIVAGSSYKAKKDKKKCVFKLWDDIEKSVKEGKTDLA